MRGTGNSLDRRLGPTVTQRFGLRLIRLDDMWPPRSAGLPLEPDSVQPTRLGIALRIESRHYVPNRGETGDLSREGGLRRIARRT